MFTRTEEGIKCLNLDSIPIVSLIFLATVTICVLQERFSSVKTLIYFMQSFRSRFTLLYMVFTVTSSNCIVKIASFLLGSGV